MKPLTLALLLTAVSASGQTKVPSYVLPIALVPAGGYSTNWPSNYHSSGQTNTNKQFVFTNYVIETTNWDTSLMVNTNPIVWDTPIIFHGEWSKYYPKGIKYDDGTNTYPAALAVMKWEVVTNWAEAFFDKLKKDSQQAGVKYESASLMKQFGITNYNPSLIYEIGCVWSNLTATIIYEGSTNIFTLKSIPFAETNRSYTVREVKEYVK